MFGSCPCVLPSTRSWSPRQQTPAALPAPQRSVFYAALSPLLAFYVLFTAVLYPLHGSLHLNGFYAATAALVPQGLHGLLKGGARGLGGQPQAPHSGAQGTCQGTVPGWAGRNAAV